MLVPRQPGGGAPRPEANDEFFTEIRANQDFEHLVVATLYGAGASTALRIAAPLVLDLADGRSIVPAIIDNGFSGLLYGFLIFLTGFATAIIVGFPLAKRFARDGSFNIAIFYGVSLGVAAASLLLVAPQNGWSVAFRLAPAVLIPTFFLFVRGRALPI